MYAVAGVRPVAGLSRLVAVVVVTVEPFGAPLATGKTTYCHELTKLATLLHEKLTLVCVKLLYVVPVGAGAGQLDPLTVKVKQRLAPGLVC